ncbi:MAG: P-II family nitrogen regulator [Bacteroidota bacterium]
MKKIEAIIRLSRFDEIRDELANIGVNFFTMSKVEGFGLEQGEIIRYRGSEFNANHVARLKLEILTAADKVDAITAAIIKAGRTGEVGDGKITVIDVGQAVRIRTGEEGLEAILPAS